MAPDARARSWRALQAFQTLGKRGAQRFQQALVTPCIRRDTAAQGIEFGQLHRQAAAQGLRQARPGRWFVEHAAGPRLLQALAHLGDVPGAGLGLATRAEDAGVTKPVGGFEIVVGLVENEEGLITHPRQARLQALVEIAQSLPEGSKVGLIALGIGRVERSQIAGHLLGDDQCIGRQQPQMGIEAAGAMIVVMLAVVVVVQQLEAHVLQPFLMGRFVSVHPLGVIVAIAMGVIVAGIPGALIAVPLAASLNAVVQHLADYTEVGEGADEAAAEDPAPPEPDGPSAEDVADIHDEGGTTPVRTDRGDADRA